MHIAAAAGDEQMIKLLVLRPLIMNRFWADCVSSAGIFESKCGFW
jgi:hypothetical protein